MRLAFWVMGVLVIFSGGLVVFINLGTAKAVSFQTTLLEPTSISSAPATMLPAALSTPPAYSDSIPNEMTPLATPQEIVLAQLRTISLIGLGLIILVGGAVVYYLAGQPLRPLRSFSHTVKHISAENLNVRLDREDAEDEFSELAETFNLMLDRLETAFNQQSMFVANAAHELRTPLAALRTNLEVVLADSEASLTEYQEMGSQLQFALDRLERLVADLLLLSSAARVDEEIVVLGPLIEQVVDNLTAMAAEKQVSLRLKGDGELEGWGNPLLLERAVYNLVENGIYYNQPQGNVEVTLFREMNKVVIRVADNGIGIPAAEQSLIFDRFYRLDRSRTRHSGGAGLGLSLVAHIVELHKGYIQLDSELDVGSTFTIFLPVPDPH